MAKNTDTKTSTSKKTIHPNSKPLVIELTNGQKYTIELWTGKEDNLKLNTDPLNHPAWTGERKLNLDTGRAASFLKKFGG